MSRVWMVFLIMALVNTEGYSRRGRLKRSFSFSKSKSTSWGWKSKKSKKVASNSPKKKSARSGSKSRWGSKNSPNASSKRAPKNLVSKSPFQKKMSAKIGGQNSKKSFSKFKSNNEKFKGKEKGVSNSDIKSNKAFSSVRDSGKFDRNSYYSRHNDYYGRHSPGPWAYQSSPSFGIWNALFLWSLLDRPAQSNHYYNNQNDPGVKEWRKEADKLAEENKELKTKLEKLDQSTSQLKESGVKRDPSQLPLGIDPDLMLSESAIKSLQPTLNLCSGVKSGNYYFTAKALANQSPLDINVIETNGSFENLTHLNSNKCDAAIVQSDAIDALKSTDIKKSMDIKEIKVMYPEFAHLICHRSSNIDSVKDLVPLLGSGKKISIGPTHSGSSLTWINFTNLDNRYKKVTTVELTPKEGLQQVMDKKLDCFFTVTSLHNEMIEKANEYGKTLKLVNVNDWDFNNKVSASGGKVYEFDKIPDSVYPNIQDGLISSSIETLVVRAVLIVNSKWASNNQDAADGIPESLVAVKDKIDKKIAPNK